MKQNDRKVNKYKIKTKEGMKKRKSLVQKVSGLWNSSQVHGMGHLLSKINGKVNI